MFMSLLGALGLARAADPALARLAVLEDRQAIGQLATGDYPRALDQRDWTGYVALFTVDGELTVLGRTLKGRAAIGEFLAGLPFGAPGAPPPRPGEIRTLHVISNLSYRIEGDTAAGGSYWQTIGVRDGQSAVLTAGHYEDVLKKGQDGRWRFASRVIVTDLPPPSPAAAGAN
jgi:uncharacterized protein (TIGR02246 family)